MKLRNGKITICNNSVSNNNDQSNANQIDVNVMSTSTATTTTSYESTSSTNSSMLSTALPTSKSTSSTTLSTSSTNSSTISLTPTPSPSSNFTPYSDSPITPCGKCVTCNKGFLNTDPEYFNKITGEKFVVTDEMNCKSTNIVYLIRCAHPNCPMQYIGQSINSLNTRCIGHRSGILRGVNEPKFILDHFKNTHNPSDLRITPLFTVTTDDGNSQTKKKSLMKNLRLKEGETMLSLNTLFPYGLNTRLETPIYIDSDEEFHNGACIYKLFPKRECHTRHHRGSKCKEKDVDSFSPSEVLDSLLNLFLANNLHKCRTLICQLNVSQITLVGKMVTERLPLSEGLERSCYLIFKDLVNHYRARNITYLEYRRNLFKVNDKPDNKYCDYVPITFISKEVENLNIQTIINDPILMKLFPAKQLNKKYQHEDFRLNTCYKHMNSIRGALQNYKSTILQVPPTTGYSCYCHLYPDHIDHDLGHVVTGELSIIANKKLRKLFSKGYNFIDPIYKNRHKIFDSLKRDVNSYIKKLSLKFSVNTAYFNEWKAALFIKVDNSLKNTRIYCKKTMSVVNSESEDLEVLKDRFVLTSVDKASNNISLICKKFYVDNLDNELNNTKTYNESNESEEEIVKRHVLFCAKYNIPVDDHCLPFVHMLPKFHKEQMDYRYIAAGKKSSTKMLSSILCSVLKLVDTTLKYSDSFEFKFKTPKAKGYWVVKNKDSAISTLNYLNNTCEAKSVYSFDFKKLYTNLPHNKVLDKLGLLIKRCFDEKKSEFINISSTFRASWSNKEKGTWSLRLNDILEMFNFLLDNIFVKFQSRIYKQVIGIPMGCSCAPQIADLFLYWYEHEYIAGEVTKCNYIVEFLRHCSRYIDDLFIPNGTKQIADIVCNRIYPLELQIVQTNVKNSSSTFLDLDVSVNNGVFSSKLYDKRRDFHFKVVSFPHLKANIPQSPAYGIFIGEVYRICKSSSTDLAFINDVKLLICKLCNQSFTSEILYRKLSSFLKSKPACIAKFWRNFNVNDFK